MKVKRNYKHIIYKPKREETRKIEKEKKMLNKRNIISYAQR